MQEKMTIGVDFGTESARAILVEVKTGKVVSVASEPYKHGVISDRLPGTSVQLGSEWALQDPQDYLDSLISIVTRCIDMAKVNSNQIIGIGIDFTASTILPVKANGQPLCDDPSFRNNPHSWVKLWKHHAADLQAKLINGLAKKREEMFLDFYGGSISSEWMLPKVLQVLNESPDIYQEADLFVEAGDWIVQQLTGEWKRNSCSAGYKNSWNKKVGFPSKAFLKALHADLENFVDEKIKTPIYPVGSYAGKLTKSAAQRLGLTEDVCVSVATIDAHAAVPGSGIVETGKMLMVMGTSICHMVMSDKEVFINGVNGVVEDGILPGYFGYEAGQAAGGDILASFIRNYVPFSYYEEAENKGISIYKLLEEKASGIKPGDTGLIVLDWFNGNRSVLNDASLSGLIVGLTLQTKPEELYLALMEGLAYGTKVIIETFENGGVPIQSLYAGGGLATKNPLLMQIFSDVTGKELKSVTTPNASGLGAAMFGAVAAGEKNGGYNTILEASAQMADRETITYRPKPRRQEIYTELYSLYLEMHQYYGKESNLMQKLKSFKS